MKTGQRVRVSNPDSNFCDREGTLVAAPAHAKTITGDECWLVLDERTDDDDTDPLMFFASELEVLQ